MADADRGWRRLAVAATVLLLLAVSVAASVLFVVAYWQSWSLAWLGGFLALALLTLGIGFVAMAHRLLPGGTYVEERELMPSSAEERAAFLADFTRGGVLPRRRVLWIAFSGAVGAFGAAAIAGARSLGPRPDERLRRTPWGPGVRVVNHSGRPVRIDEIPVGGMVTVFPEGHVQSADGQTVLVRVGEDTARRARTAPSAETVYAYSKVCTHMGCPVGQYLAETHELMCPCHQTIFAVLDGGTPTFGPAGRALPQLPLRVAEDGTLVARGDFPSPVGPTYWTMP